MLISQFYRTAFIVALICATRTVSADTAIQCSADKCKAGMVVRTFFKKTDPYYECPTKELGIYVETVIGFVSIGVAMGAGQPNISPTTGEPEYQGASKQMLDDARHAAQVSTFDEALTRCRKGAPNKLVTIMNMPADGLMAWVQDPRRLETFWMPVTHMDLPHPGK